MNKRVFIVHGRDGFPEEGWFPWLKSELEKRGFIVEVPAMPNPSQPRIEEWVSYLAQIAGKVDKNTFFVGHSIGCQTILRYLEKLPQSANIGGMIFVAGWFTLMNLKTQEEKEIANPWLEKPINEKKVLEHTKNILVILSDNDYVVPLDNQKNKSHHTLKGVVCDRLLFLGLQKSKISESSQNQRF